MRGLKHHPFLFQIFPFPSHLLQMRGLKQLVMKSFKDGKVASFTDAWIETAGQAMRTAFGEVASFTDAWIETFLNSAISEAILSHLLQMRGLKQTGNWHLQGYIVASFTDAWIETESVAEAYT